MRTPVSVVSATKPAFTVMVPALATSTILPLLAVVRSAWLLLLVDVLAVILTRCTPTLTVSTTTASVSMR